jgi:hypothetical protein
MLAVQHLLQRRAPAIACCAAVQALLLLLHSEAAAVVLAAIAPRGSNVVERAVAAAVTVVQAWRCTAAAEVVRSVVQCADSKRPARENKGGSHSADES